MVLGLGLAGVGVASEAAAQPGAPRSGARDFWDPGWGKLGHGSRQLAWPGPNPSPVTQVREGRESPHLAAGPAGRVVPGGRERAGGRVVRTDP
ncbi:hypothetical protein [Mycobacterium ulcerans]|uniref:hypothetical protein n=1 Tax=Mycobacterium ulcerans TaxID=1809 RepID=UPI001C5A165B|nr:hypothetical protein [Mycobacterium ulcerans]